MSLCWWDLPKNKTALLGTRCPKLSIYSQSAPIVGSIQRSNGRGPGWQGLQKMLTGSVMMPGNWVCQRWHCFDLLCHASLKCSSVLRLRSPPCLCLPLGLAACPSKTSPRSPRKLRRKWTETKELCGGDGDVKSKSRLAEKAQGFLLVNCHCGKCAGSAAVAGGEGRGVVHQVVFWSCEPRALGPDSSYKKCNGRKSSYFPEIFVTIQGQQCFSAEIHERLGFFAANHQ